MYFAFLNGVPFDVIQHSLTSTTSSSSYEHDQHLGCRMLATCPQWGGGYLRKVYVTTGTGRWRIVYNLLNASFSRSELARDIALHFIYRCTCWSSYKWFTTFVYHMFWPDSPLQHAVPCFSLTIHVHSKCRQVVWRTKVLFMLSRLGFLLKQNTEMQSPWSCLFLVHCL